MSLIALPYTQAIHAAEISNQQGEPSNRVEIRAVSSQGGGMDSQNLGGRQHAHSTLHAGTFEDLLAAANQALHPQPPTLNPAP